MCIYLFSSNLSLDKSVHDAICVLLFLYQNFMKTKCFISKWIHAYKFVPVRILKDHLLLKLENFLKNGISYPIYEQVPLNICQY